MLPMKMRTLSLSLTAILCFGTLAAAPNAIADDNRDQQSKSSESRSQSADSRRDDSKSVERFGKDERHYDREKLLAAAHHAEREHDHDHHHNPISP
jgi:hypothetical protein